MHCVVSLNKTLYPLLSTGSTQEDRKLSQHDWKIVDWNVKLQHKQNDIKLMLHGRGKFHYPVHVTINWALT